MPTESEDGVGDGMGDGAGDAAAERLRELLVVGLGHKGSRVLMLMRCEDQLIIYQVGVGWGRGHTCR